MSSEAAALSYNPTPEPLPLRKDSVLAQALWYLLVGGLSFLADLFVFTLLLRQGLPVLPALTTGFIVGTVTNYILSLLLAFQGGRHSRWGEIWRFIAVSLVGLLLTAILVSLLMAVGVSGLWAKIIATGPVLAWNYTGRRLLVFRRDMPETSWVMADRAARNVRRRRVTR